MVICYELIILNSFIVTLKSAEGDKIIKVVDLKAIRYGRKCKSFILNYSHCSIKNAFMRTSVSVD